MANEQPTWAGLQEALEAIRTEWPNLSTNPRLKFDAEREWVLQACEKSDYAKKAAVGNIDATCAALRNVAAVGVTLDPARKLAYIIPRDGKMIYDLSYMGLLDIATGPGALQWAQARIVHENDLFELSGYDAPPLHKFKPFGKPEERGPIVGAYVVVKTSGGDYLTNPMHVDDINGIRDRSSAWKQRDVKKPNSGGPWATDWNEMAKKTCVKNAYKYWPRSEALDRAIHYLNTDGDQGIELDTSKTSKTMLAGWKKKLADAKNGDEVAAVWKAGREDFKAANDTAGYEEFKVATAARNKELGVAPAAAQTTAPAPTAAPVAQLEPGKATYAQIADAITKAPTYEALDATGPLIDAMNEEQAGELNALFNARLEELKKTLG